MSRVRGAVISDMKYIDSSEFCTAEDALYLTHLPFSNIIEENEQHVLIECPSYHEFRLNLLEHTINKSLLLQTKITTNSLNGNM